MYICSILKINKSAYSSCSINGKKYELQVYNIVKNCKYNNIYFNRQNVNDLGGCNSINDLVCCMNYMDIPIEIKTLSSPDWMQCSLKYDNNKWVGSSRNKIPIGSKIIFERLIQDTYLFNGLIPPFIYKSITHSEWTQIKKYTNDFNDLYIDCPKDTIKNLYREKGCVYIQVSDKGLYHLGNDVCNFGVPEFICDQQLRVRTKIHATKNSYGYCKLSVIVSCQPKNRNSIIKSPFSLDDYSRLPYNLQRN